MSIKFWEYSGPVDIFYQAYRENASKHMPDRIWYDDPRKDALKMINQYRTDFGIDVLNNYENLK